MPSTTTQAVRANGEKHKDNREVVFEGVEKRYEDGTIAVENLNLTCPGGLITVFVGPSGCGKTTSLRMINKMLTPTAGRILLGGEDISDWDETSLRLNMGYVIQDGGLFPHRTVVDNIATLPMLLGTKKRQARAEAVELMARMGLDAELASRYPYQLSGGQQQRVGVARALAADPPVLLMDEPFSAVDPLVRGELQVELLRLQSELAKTIVFVTHDIDEAVRLGDQIAVFEPGGHVAQVGGPEDLLTRPHSDYVSDFIGTDSGVKWLSLRPVKDVPLQHDGIFSHDDTEISTGDGWNLIVDKTNKPLGWLAPEADLQNGATLQPCRQTLTLENDTLRTALNAVVLSPARRAVVTDSSGHVTGLIDYESVVTAIERQQDLANV